MASKLLKKLGIYIKISLGIILVKKNARQ